VAAKRTPGKNCLYKMTPVGDTGLFWRLFFRGIISAVILYTGATIRFLNSWITPLGGLKTGDGPIFLQFYK